jgi:hypothetical protein
MGAARLIHVAQSLQTQVDRDFSAAWGARARVRAAPGTAAPDGTWPIYLVGGHEMGPGIHAGDGGDPFAEVTCGDGWTLAASHVLLEMIADPRGDRLMDGPRPAPGTGRRPVRYLVEVCDPCQVFHYVIDGVEVSNFVTPDYYRADAMAVDFLRLIRRPLEVWPGCSLAWQDPEDGHWHQKRPDGTFARSAEPIQPGRRPREDRDRAFPEDAGRHTLAAIRRRRTASAGGRRGVRRASRA